MHAVRQYSVFTLSGAHIAWLDAARDDSDVAAPPLTHVQSLTRLA